MINQNEIYPLLVEMHVSAVNELIRVLVSFIILVCLLIEKATESDIK